MLDSKSAKEAAAMEQKLQEEVISNAYNEAVINPDAFEQLRLSQGKKILLEHFKQSIIAYESIQDNYNESDEINNESLKQSVIPFKKLENIIVQQSSGFTKEKIKQSQVLFQRISQILQQESHAGQKEKLESLKRSAISFDVRQEMEEREEKLSISFEKKPSKVTIRQKPDFYIREDQSKRSNKLGQSESDHQSEIKLSPLEGEQIKDSIVNAKKNQGILQQTQLQATPTFVIPNPNHQENLEEKIKKAICCLCKGVRVSKCCLNRLKIEQCMLCFQESFNFMSLRVLNKDDEKVYRTAVFEQVLKGIQTTNFKRYLEEIPKLNPDLCFSISLSDRTFDFVSKSTAERDTIVRQIEFLRNFMND